MEFDRGRIAAFDADGHQGAGLPRRYFCARAVIWIIRKADIIDPRDLWMSFEEFRDFPAVFDVAFHAQRNGFDSLQEQESAQRRQHRAGRSLVDAAATRNVCGLTEVIGIGQAMIRVVRLG